MIFRYTINPDSDNIIVSEPINWDETIFEISRHDKWHGIFFDYSFPLQFADSDAPNGADNAYTFIKNAYDASGVDAEVYLDIEIDCNDSGTFEYLYRGKLNMDTVEFSEGDDCIASLTIEPVSILSLFKNRINQKVNLATTESFDGVALTSYDYLNFLMLLPAKVLLQQADLTSSTGGSAIEGSAFDELASGFSTTTKTGLFYAPFGFNPIAGIDEINTRATYATEILNSYADMVPLYEVQYDGTYVVTVTMSANARLGILLDATETTCGYKHTFNYMSVEVWLEVGGTALLLANADIDNICSLTGEGDGEDIEYVVISLTAFEEVLTVDMIAGDEILMYVRIYGEGEYNQGLLVKDVYWSTLLSASATMNIDAYVTPPDTYCRVFMINEVFSRISEAITNGQLRALSNYYGRTNSEPYPAPSGNNGDGSHRVLTTGLHIRQFPAAALNMSFEECFDNCNAIDNIGFGIEPDAERQGNYSVVRIEDMNYWYDPDTVLMQCDSVREIKRKVMNDKIFSRAKFGYAKYENEEYSGLDEFLTSREYRSTSKIVDNTIEFISQFIASGYAIEIGRNKQYDSVTQADWRYDKDTFIICVRAVPYIGYEVEQGNIDAAEDMISPETVYNFAISPIRNALRWLKTLLNSYRDISDPESYWTFTDGSGNVIAQGLNTGTPVIESESIQENSDLDINSIDEFTDAYYPHYPELWTYDYPMSFEQYKTVKANPKGIIQVQPWRQLGYTDTYIKQIAYKPTEGMATFNVMPKRPVLIGECCLIVLNIVTSAAGTTVGNSSLIGKSITDIFVWYDGKLLSHNDAVTNDITAFNSNTGYFQLGFEIPLGKQITILALRDMSILCCPEVYNYTPDRDADESVSGLTFIDADLIGWSLSDLHIYYDGLELKWNDAEPTFNEIASFDTLTGTITFNEDIFGTEGLLPDREFRIFGIRECQN